MAFLFYPRQALQWLLLLGLLTLSACGFHLRGPANLPFQTISLGFPANSALGVELKRHLRASSVEVVDHQNDAQVILEVLADTREKKILSLNTNGRVREYSLYQRFRFQLKNHNGALLITPTEIVLNRNITYDENQELAKQSEELLLYRDMQSDLVQQILRRLAASKPDVANDALHE